MAIETGNTGSSTTGSLDINALLQSALAGGSMSGLLGNDGNIGSGLVLGLLLGRNGLWGNNGNWENRREDENTSRAAIDAAVSAALAQNNQANNNAMLLLKDIQDSSQEVVSTVNSTSQTALIQQLQSQIAIQQGQATLGTAISESKGAVVNEVHEVGQIIGNQLDTINTNMLTGFNNVTREITNDGDKTRALIQSIETANLNRMLTVAQNEITELRNEGRIRGSEVNITQNVNQNQAQQQQQQQIWQINNLLQDLIAQQKITQSTINLGTMSGGAGQQTAANTRVNS